MDPSFFKPLVGDFLHKLQIPSAFIEKMEGKLASKLVLKYECGRLYYVKMKELEDGHFFVNGWPDFVKDHGLEYGDFVVFRLIEDSTFHVTIYDPSMCEKQCCDSHRYKNDSDQKHSLSDQDHTKGPNLAKKNQESPIKMEIESSDDEWKGPCSNTDDAPSFTLVLNEANKIYLPLESSFVTKTGLAKKEEVKVRDKEGRKWVVKIVKDGKRVGLTRGWSDIFMAHRLKKGDSCIFKYLSKGGVGFIQVDVKRGRGRPPKIP
ncbi:B3 domain-containing protein REM5-like isoform X2 [Apium graveolens]|uniref:B3 domain-containing protein REM5-like isoform X2 n=1 Tax=Apium graveolens TaxID=4045 RepID=UPI003D7BDDFA